MVRYMKDRGTYVLFNTNGTLLNKRKGLELIETPASMKLRVSIDAGRQPSSKWCAVWTCSIALCPMCAHSPACNARFELELRRVSLYGDGIKETMSQLPSFVKLGPDRSGRSLFAAPGLFPDVKSGTV